jgi:hypothetical protein
MAAQRRPSAVQEHPRPDQVAPERSPTLPWSLAVNAHDSAGARRHHRRLSEPGRIRGRGPCCALCWCWLSWLVLAGSTVSSDSGRAARSSWQLGSLVPAVSAHHWRPAVWRAIWSSATLSMLVLAVLGNVSGCRIAPPCWRCCSPGHWVAAGLGLLAWPSPVPLQDGSGLLMRPTRCSVPWASTPSAARPDTCSSWRLVLLVDACCIKLLTGSCMVPHPVGYDPNWGDQPGVCRALQRGTRLAGKPSGRCSSGNGELPEHTTPPGKPGHLSGFTCGFRDNG